MKLVLAVIDGAKPEMVERAISTGQAPALAEIAARGSGIHACTAAFPSVTPVCAATIATGVRQDRHHIPAMNWWSRAERRYIEYGSSFAAARRFGINRQLIDTVYNMNAEHLAEDARTVFEALDAEDVRTAGTTYLMYRGLHTHEPAREFALSRIASATLFRRPVQGPRELFYADLFASRATGCWSQLGLPGMRDQHAGCVGAYLVEHDLFDFLLLSLPDNDTHSHKHGPHAQVASIAAADRQIERVMHASGGTDAFLEEHAVIVVSDHSHAPVEEEIAFVDAFDGWDVAAPTRPGRVRPERAEIAMCPSQRAAMVYVLLEEGREAAIGPIVEAAGDLEGVDLVLWRDGRRGRHRLRPRRAALRPRRRPARPPRRAVVRPRRPRGPAGRDERRGDRHADVPRRAGACVGGADLPDVRRRAAERRARLRVPRLGRRRAHGRREPRLAAPRRLRGRAASWPASKGRRSAPTGTRGASSTSPRWRSATSSGASVRPR